MSSNGRAKPVSERFSRQPLAGLLPIVAVIGVLLVLVGTAVVIARGDSAEEIAGLSGELRWSDSVASGTRILRAEVREALLIGQTAAEGLVDESQFDVAAGHVDDAAAEVARRASILASEYPESDLGPVVSDLTAVATLIADAIRAEDVESAIVLSEDDFAGASDLVISQSEGRSQELVDQITIMSTELGTVTTAARYVSALLIPALALFLLFRWLRSGQTVSLLRSELGRERELRRKKDAFVAAASHHIRTPLAAVVGFAELLRDRTRDFSAAVRLEVTELLALQARETSSVVDDLLVAARYDLGELDLYEEEVHIRDVVDAASADWAVNQRLRLSIRGDAVTVTDPKWLTHALRNVLRNAVSFGGEHVEVDIHERFRSVVIEVTDDGESLPEDEAEKIFELYYSYRQVEGLAPSLGLGLSVSRRIAKAMGGNLEFHRADGKNVFELTIPKSESSPQAIDLTAATTIEPASMRPTPEMIDAVIQAGGPEILYDPIVDMSPMSGRVVGFEASPRFEEETTQQWLMRASAIGRRHDLELACIAAATAGFSTSDGDAFLAVSLSDRTLHSSRLLDVIDGIDNGRLVLELAEGAMIKSYQATRAIVESLEELGIRVAVDDVGSGEVDLWRMTRIGAQMIKIDISLIARIPASPRERALVRALTAMASELGAHVIAEGVETEVQHTLLAELGVGFGQGPLYGKPGSIGDWDGWSYQPSRRDGWLAI